MFPINYSLWIFRKIQNNKNLIKHNWPNLFALIIIVDHLQFVLVILFVSLPVEVGEENEEYCRMDQQQGTNESGVSTVRPKELR